ncbi:hypothetical protein LF1_56520 [Rubripirellula obstinata]|uniref:Uncharacterized protein n=1 Tax=Rubripirellula obstinata TaxID=406547 RepID=A0A5B1CBY7_9BACT|nr:hypothetical protein LF1_56520 [Rubripirellula obstinata]
MSNHCRQVPGPQLRFHHLIIRQEGRGISADFPALSRSTYGKFWVVISVWKYHQACSTARRQRSVNRKVTKFRHFRVTIGVWSIVHLLIRLQESESNGAYRLQEAVECREGVQRMSFLVLQGEQLILAGRPTHRNVDSLAILCVCQQAFSRDCIPSRITSGFTGPGRKSQPSGKNRASPTPVHPLVQVSRFAAGRVD